MNMTKLDTTTDLSKVSGLLQAISTEPRLQILLAIGGAEACVCHLEAVLGYRQAYISQQLMALREAGILDTRRDGKYIYYHLENPALLEMVKATAHLAGQDISAEVATVCGIQTQCECPRCSLEKE
jgi:DNA-binding transcriptional ArsR family regulator